MTMLFHFKGPRLANHGNHSTHGNCGFKTAVTDLGQMTLKLLFVEQKDRAI
jgi:hypothetical protein